ncbi:MAG: Zn-ribbon domain-containing OB-fold protein [Anaerolineales bacterium]|jgi:uncharacterized OB-fold protein
MQEDSFSQAEFYNRLAEHKIMGSKCSDCGQLYLPPRPMCTKCFGRAMEWTELKPTGELLAFTVIYIAPTAMLEAGYGRENPYCSGIVRLEQGVSISAQILGVDVGDPESIQIGLPLQAEFIERGEGEARKTLLAFHPSAAV